ncbi:4-Cys prefix domain-containing protein [Coleofasciculus sp. A1-SPW-01]
MYCTRPHCPRRQNIFPFTALCAVIKYSRSKSPFLRGI